MTRNGDAMRLSPGARVLDTGAGTGIAARVASQAASGVVAVALDPAIEMLRVGRRHGLAIAVGGQAQALPFADGTFDGVMASFVISHVPSYEAALAEMVRVLRRGGTVGVTAWGPAEGRYRKHW